MKDKALKIKLHVNSSLGHPKLINWFSSDEVVTNGAGGQFIFYILYIKESKQKVRYEGGIFIMKDYVLTMP